MNNTFAVVRKAYESSVLNRFIRFWQRSWCESLFCGCLMWLLSLPCADEHSALRQRHNRFNARLGQANRLYAAIYSSRLQRIWAGICRVGQESRLLGWVFREGATGVLLFLLALYTPIDYVLRDVFSIPVISSVWDEALLLLALVWVLVQRVKQRPVLCAATTPLDWPVLFFLGICIALFFVRMRLVSINLAGLRATAQYILWFFLATRLIHSERQCRMVYDVMVAVAAVIGHFDQPVAAGFQLLG